MKRNCIPLPTTFLLIYLMLTIILQFFFPIKNLIGSFQVLGVIFIVLGLLINFWTDSLFKKEKTTVKPNKIPRKLITEGPFRISRHPMYLGFVVLLLGIALVLGNIFSFIGPIMMFITLEKKFIPLEEKLMEKHFGKKYQEYKNQVRRWL